MCFYICYFVICACLCKGNHHIQWTNPFGKLLNNQKLQLSALYKQLVYIDELSDVVATHNPYNIGLDTST